VLREILPQIVPYLIVKRTTAEKMLEYFTFLDINPIYGWSQVPPGYYEKLDALYDAIKKLNAKGRIGRSAN
jgi:hypothetical protein